VSATIHDLPDPWSLAQARRADLRGAERAVADYISAHPDRIVFMSAMQLAEAAGASDATVIRTAKSLGFQGFSDLKHAVGDSLMRNTDPALRMERRLTAGDRSQPGDVLDTVLGELRERLEETGRRNPPEALDRALTLLMSAQRVVAFGVGTSRLCADYLTGRLRRIGIAAVELQGMGFALADALLELRPDDVAVVFAPGRWFREVDVLVEEIGRLGGGILLITDTLELDEDARHAVLRAPLSPGGLSGEPIAAMALTDAIVLALGRRSPARATETSSRLTRLRSTLQRGHAGTRSRSD
jgi:DNA-binding MurR/RpiR family transcriptional regulator